MEHLVTSALFGFVVMFDNYHFSSGMAFFKVPKGTAAASVNDILARFKVITFSGTHTYSAKVPHPQVDNTPSTSSPI